MDTLLSQMEAQDSIQRLQIKDSSEECLRWANLQRKSTKKSFQTVRNANKSNTRHYKSNKISCDYCFAMGKDEKTWKSHDKLNCYLLFPEKKRTRLNTRMLSVSVLTDDNETWDLQQALDSITEQYYASHAEEESHNPPGEDLSPQWLTVKDIILPVNEEKILHSNSVHLSWLNRQSCQRITSFPS